MSTAKTLAKLNAYKKNPDVFQALSNQELADLVILVLSQVNVIENAITTKKLDLDTKFSQTAETAIAGMEMQHSRLVKELTRRVNNVITNADSILSETANNLEKRVKEAIQNIRNGENGIVTEDEIIRAAQIASKLIELPDFDTLVTTEITRNGEAIRDALELLQENSRYAVEISDVRGLKDEIEKLYTIRSSGQAGGVSKNTVLQLIAENSSGISDGDKGDITVSGNGTVWSIDADTIGQDELATTGTPDGTKFLRDDMEWTAIPGGGDMLASTYDTDTDGIVDAAEMLVTDTTRTGDVNLGEIAWDNDKETFVFGIDGSSVGANQPFWYIRNNTGSTLTKGTPVYATGTLGASGRITVAKFIANGTVSKELLLGVLIDDVTNGADGIALSQGKIRQLDTSTFTNGQILYPSASVAGTFTATEPTAPNLSMPIAFVVYAHATVGEIAVRITHHDDNESAPLSHTHTGDEVTLDATGLSVLDATDAQAAYEQTDTALRNARETGVFSGGIVSIDGGNTTFSVTAGVGEILDMSTPTAPVYAHVTWSSSSGVTPTSMSGRVYIYIDSSGTLQQTTSAPTPANRRTRIYLAYVAGNGTALIGTALVNTPIAGTDATIGDLAEAIGTIRKSGSAPTSSGANLKLKISAGEFFDYGVTRGITPNAPNTPSAPLFDTGVSNTFSYLLTSGLGLTAQTDVDVGYYQTGGVRTAIPGASTRYGIHYVLGLPSGNTYLVYDNDWHTTEVDALESLSANHFYADLVPGTTTRLNSFILGAVIAQKGATDLSNAAQATFVTTNRFGEFNGAAAVAGGGYLEAANNLSDLASAATALTNLGLTQTAAKLNTTISRTVTVTSGSYTAGSTANTDYVYLIAGAHNGTLPAASGNSNRYTLKNNHSSSVIITRAGADTVEGETSLTIEPTHSIDLISDGTSAWYVI